MAALIIDAATSARLARIPQKDTDVERAVRKMLHHLGVRFRVRNRDLPGSPDLANRLRRWAIFVHGCFWHAHPRCVRATLPKRNREFWAAKFAANRQRDQRAVHDLRRMGYVVVVVWECQVRDSGSLRRSLTRILATRARGGRRHRDSSPRRSMLYFSKR